MVDPIRVVHACPCFLAQNVNETGEILALLRGRIAGVSDPELRKHLKSLEKEVEKLKADAREHIGVWRDRYALVMMDQMKRLDPMQTSAWKQGDLKKLLEEKPKKSGSSGTKRSAPADGALAAASVKREKQQEDSLED